MMEWYESNPSVMLALVMVAVALFLLLASGLILWLVL